TAKPLGSAVSVWTTYFFFSSRRRHTRFSRDWSSDVCSSDLEVFAFEAEGGHDVVSDHLQESGLGIGEGLASVFAQDPVAEVAARSEERRVGKEGRAGGAPER